MLKRYFFIICSVLSFIASAQDSSKVILSGSIKDAENGEALIGATILVKAGVGAVADLDGNFVLTLPKGDYVIEASMLGYGKYTQKVKLYANKKIEIKLENKTLDEVEVVADIAKIRETPVAFSSISATKIQEELGGKDISMIANTTPGAYATSQGGGAGDSRVTIRGFDQRNIGVLVDGIPVNDMENGNVFWSNWDGLKDITKSMQIQRGLGASKLAISSVGGTMNFITNGIDSKKQLLVKKEWGNNRANVMSMAYNSGLINNKWGFTLAGSYRSGDGWVKGTWYDAYSYFAKIQFMPSPKHIISIGANGAPQSHGQRFTKMPIAVYNIGDAQKLGVNINDGYMTGLLGNGFIPDTVSNTVRDVNWNPDMILLDKTALLNERVNKFHKPLFNLNHFWKITEKTTLSTVLYMSIGRGGGSNFSQSGTTRDLATGYYVKNTPAINNSLSNAYPGERKQNTILRMQNNSHNWYGVLSTATSNLNKFLTFTYGIDVRYYEGYHTNTVYNLLGGDYYQEQSNPLVNSKDKKNLAKRKNDLYGVDNIGYVKWGGLFSQVEYKKNKVSTFLTISASKSGYNRKDYYKKKDVFIDGQKYEQVVGFGETYFNNGTQTLVAVQNSTITTNGDTTFVKQFSNSTKQSILNAKSVDFDSDAAKISETGWKWQLGYTIKGGANYNINDHHNVFVNVGIMQIPQKLANVFSSSNKLVKDFKPQKVNSFEVGYGLKFNKFYSNVNLYYTTWANQPQSPTIIDNVSYNINGVNALYKGFEFDFTYKFIKQIEIEGLFSAGDWKYTSGGIVTVVDANGVETDALDYDAKNIHMGNAAQTQAGLGVRLMPIKGFYLKPRITYFAKNYSNFNAIDLRAVYDSNGKLLQDDRAKESWKMPNYYFCDLSAGYEVPFKDFKVNIYGTVNNFLNTRYISDAQNNGFNNNYNQSFSAGSASVYYGVGRTYTIGTKLTF